MKTNSHSRKLGQAARQVRPRAGFTLVELLVVITVMTTLGSMLAYALASATRDAQIKRTQADTLSIGQLLQSRVNEVSLSQLNLVYGMSGLELLRRGSISPQAISGAGTAGLTDNSRRIAFLAKERARLILAARRDMARMTLPQCRADLLLPPASLQFRTFSGTGWLPNVAQLKPPAQWNRMRVRAGLLSAADADALSVGNPTTDPTIDAIEYAFDFGSGVFRSPFNLFATPYQPSDGSGPILDTIDDDPGQPSVAGDPNDRYWSRENESAECLYLILATTQLFGETAIDQVSSSQIGDTDGDGFREVLDPWGQPYEFIRDPIGYSDSAIKNFNRAGNTPAEQFPMDPDPFDFLAADVRFDTSTHTATPAQPETAYFPIFLPPMVISAGPDGEFGLRLSFVDEDSDDVPEEGVNINHSSSVVQYPSGNGGYAPLYPGLAVSRYPDPFFDVSQVPANNSGRYFFDSRFIINAKQGGGLGAILDREFSADNISSIDADL